MEDFLKFLLIAGVILVGIFKEVSKNNKSKKTQNKRPVPPPAPSPVEVDPDATPIPDFWGRSRPMDELLQPIPIEPPAPKPAPKKKKKEEISVAASIANSSAQDKRNTKQGSHYDHPEPAGDQDFSIHSVEEARRAIIWGEILQRKY